MANSFFNSSFLTAEGMSQFLTAEGLPADGMA
jgi:hypothetical protein